MPELIFLGTAERVEELEIDEDPAHAFPCIHSRGLHRDARAQLYALVTGRFFDEALDLEFAERHLTDEGPVIHALERELVQALAGLDEDDIAGYVDLWMECGEVEELDMESDDLIEFVMVLANLCQAAVNEEDLGIYVYSDD